MEPQIARRLVALLARERRITRYAEGREAGQLLAYAFPEGARVADIKKTRFAPFLDRPAMKLIVARSGGTMTRALFEAVGAGEEFVEFVLGYDVWGAFNARDARWRQVSRRGLGLVLQLNFTGAHAEAYRRALKRGDQDYFSYYGHPVAGESAPRRTCAWVRIDIEPETGEALIEEVQNDWIRRAGDAYDRARRLIAAAAPKYEMSLRPSLDRVPAERVARYYEEALAPYVDVWREAALSATLALLVETIGVRTVFMHSSAGGCRLKRIDDSVLPPRSIYEDLPRRFAFERTREAPEFLLRSTAKAKRKALARGEIEFWRHRF